jgi:hypothetical protein
MSYPVTLETRLPVRFERVQLFVRLIVFSILGLLHQTAGGLLGALYLVLPVAVALILVQRGGDRFLSEDGSWLRSVLEWVVAVYAYLLFVSDRFPLPSREKDVRVVVRTAGPGPTASGALLRLVTSLPHAVVLAVLGVAAGLVAFVAALSVLFVESYPVTLQKFQRDVLLWMTRLFAYHAALVEPYPPFVLGTGDAMPPGHDDPYAPPF